jgi:hypothetical protein
MVLPVLEAIGRRVSSPYRALPDFIIIGAQKAGTSSLYSYLVQHPDIVPAAKKELHFFDDDRWNGVSNYPKGRYWYQARFPLRSQLRTGKLTGEATPLYLFHPLAADRMYRLVPQARLIVLLRHPSERAVSHYFHMKNAGREHLSLREALRAEEARLAPAFRAQDWASPEFKFFSYKARGRYAEQIERFLAYYPRERMLFVRSDELFSDPAAVVRQVCGFLELPPLPIADFGVRNQGRKSDVDPAVYEYLDEHFRLPNQRLEELLGHPLGWQ